MKKITQIAIILTAILTTGSIMAQELPVPSPAAKVEQRIGLTDVTINYSRPSVKGRKIWGALEKFDKVWRAGANANTTVAFSDDVKIGGKDLRAGTYSFFIIPTKGEWVVIFNRVIDGWGTGKYNEENDILRLEVEAEKLEIIQESLKYSIENLTPTSGDFVFSWERMTFSLKIEVLVEKKAWENIEIAFKEATPENKAEVYRNAAKYTVTSKTRLKEGLEWIDKSIKVDQHWYSHWVKADVLYAMGKKEEAIESANMAITLGEDDAKQKGKTFGYAERLEEVIQGYK